MTKQAFLFLHLQLHYPELAILHVSHCFRDFVVIYNSLPMHAALVRAVLHVRALFEKMRARVDLQIARYYIVLLVQYSIMSQPPWSNFRGGGGWRPRRPPGSYASAVNCIVFCSIFAITLSTAPFTISLS